MARLNSKTIDWKTAWASPWFKKTTMLGLALLILAAACLPFFFAYIESRSGTLLNDPLLNWLTPSDHSVLIFSLIWGMVLVALIGCWKNPVYFLHLLIGYNLILVSRYITISLFSLEPPTGWIELKDPLIHQFYGGTFITRDLFYSGHTATMWLIVFSAYSLPFIGRLAGSLVALTVGFLVLKQHIHYTIDVIAAPLFAYGAAWLARKYCADWRMGLK